jgi:hypothetical protein
MWSLLFFLYAPDKMYASVLSHAHIQEINGLDTVIHHRSRLLFECNVKPSIYYL